MQQEGIDTLWTWKPKDAQNGCEISVFFSTPRNNNEVPGLVSSCVALYPLQLWPSVSDSMPGQPLQFLCFMPQKPGGSVLSSTPWCWVQCLDSLLAPASLKMIAVVGVVGVMGTMVKSGP